MLTLLNRFIGLVISTLRLFGQWRVWLLLLGYFLLNWLVLFAHYDFSSPLFYAAVSTWTSLLGPDGFSLFSQQQVQGFFHYPYHFAYLGDFFGWAKLGLGLLLEGLVLGLAALALSRRLPGLKSTPTPGRSWWLLWLNLAAVWFLLNLLTVAAASLLPLWAAPLLTGPRRIMAFNFVLLPAVFTFILSLLFAAIPSVVFYSENVWRALGRSLRLFASRPFTCFVLAALVLILPVLVETILIRPGYIIENFKPELVYWLLLAGLVVELPANFFWMGSAVTILAESEE